MLAHCVDWRLIFVFQEQVAQLSRSSFLWRSCGRASLPTCREWAARSRMVEGLAFPYTRRRWEAVVHLTQWRSMRRPEKIFAAVPNTLTRQRINTKSDLSACSSNRPIVEVWRYHMSRICAQGAFRTKFQCFFWIVAEIITPFCS